MTSNKTCIFSDMRLKKLKDDLNGNVLKVVTLNVCIEHLISCTLISLHI